MNNGYDPNEENNDSLFSRFEDALANNQEFGEDDYVETEQVEQEKSDNTNYDDSPTDRLEDFYNKYRKNKNNENTPDNSGETGGHPENHGNSSGPSLGPNDKPKTTPENGSPLPGNKVDKTGQIPNNRNNRMLGDNPSSPNNFGKGKGLSNPTAPGMSKGAEEATKLGKGAADAAQLGKGAADAATVGKGIGDATVGGTAVGKGVADAGTAIAGGTTVAGGAAAVGGATATAGGTAAAGGTAVVGGTVETIVESGVESTNPVGWVILGVKLSVLIVIVVVIIFVVVIVILLAIAFLVAVTIDNANYSNNNQNLSSIYGNTCSYITVTDNAAAGTYDLETYVAGVISAEVAMFNNDEVYKTFAVAARSYVLTHHSNCTIAGNATKQAFNIPTNPRIIAAANATAGQVMTNDGKIFSTEYDGFAVNRETDDAYYLSQQNQRIPKSWVSKYPYLKNNVGWYQKYKHGRGMSQWGSLYLAETGSGYQSILGFYYPNANLAQLSEMYTGGDVKPTTSTKIINESLVTFLPKHGSSVDQLNQTIFINVRNAGLGTRQGAVAAAVTLLSYVDQYGVRLPYKNGGGHGSQLDIPNQYYSDYNYSTTYGVNPHWGEPAHKPGEWSSQFGPYANYGLDCSGFVAWAIRNGGYKMTWSANGEGYSSKTCSASSQNCSAQAGDLLLSPGHVVMIVKVESNRYLVAEAANRNKGMLIQYVNKSSNYTVVNMDEFYNNPNNKRTDGYPG